ncbi:MAG TPA: MFS transporter [Xanthobacteraceae bacterium]|nr:MFS transporter [Xanthobacteraceae bacterium]
MNAANFSTSQTDRRISIAFLNWAHAIDHYVILIFATVVIQLQLVYGRSYSDLIWLGTGLFVAFGVCSLPAGWLADRWSRRNMMAAFYFGCGVALALAAIAPNLTTLAVALFAVGVFAAIYHPVGMAMLIDVSGARGRTLAFNGVCGNLGAALAAGITAAFVSWLGWRGAFAVPAVICIATGVAYLALVPDDRHRTGTRQSVAEVAFSARIAIAVFGLYIVISLASGLIFNTVSVALPKIVDERVGQAVTLTAVGWLATSVFLCGAVAQFAMGRLIERYSPPILFAGVVTLQFIGLLWSAYATGPALMLALALTMATIYGQVTAGDIVIARYTADAWRGRIYAVRYFLTFTTSAAAVAAIAFLHARGGFDLVLLSIAAIAAVLVASVQIFVALVLTAERGRRRAVQPAE